MSYSPPDIEEVTSNGFNNLYDVLAEIRDLLKELLGKALTKEVINNQDSMCAPFAPAGLASASCAGGQGVINRVAREDGSIPSPDTSSTKNVPEETDK